MAGTLLAALGCIMAVACPAVAEVTASELAGRWSSIAPLGDKDCNDAGCRLTYDLAPCGDAWCGVEVKDNHTCGRIAFRLNAGIPKQQRVEFFGSYERAEGTQAYRVRASLYARPSGQLPSGHLMLSVLGNTDGDFQPFRRNYPLNMLLSRHGEAVCRAQPKVS